MKSYKLIGREIVECDTYEWGLYYQSTDRHIGLNNIFGVRISTVFLGIDHSFGSGGRPVLFESMIFGGEHDEFLLRYCTYDEAEAGHKMIYNTVFASQAKPFNKILNLTICAFLLATTLLGVLIFL